MVYAKFQVAATISHDCSECLNLPETEFAQEFEVLANGFLEAEFCAFQLYGVIHRPKPNFRHPKDRS